MVDLLLELGAESGRADNPMTQEAFLLRKYLCEFSKSLALLIVSTCVTSQSRYPSLLRRWC